MSESNTTSNTCANCGKEGSEVTNTCNKCKEVMYCNASCKKKHRHKHKKECEKRVAELHDRALFKQPQKLDDCPICFLLMPSNSSVHVYKTCCGKVICRGCIHAANVRDKKRGSLCPFCRTPPPVGREEVVERYKKRMEVDDPIAIHNIGSFYSEGRHGLPQSCTKALELWHQAGKLGYSEAYYNIGNAYYFSEGVGTDKKKKAIHYWELAAMKGEAMARNNLGVIGEAGNMDRALKHYMIAVEGGYKDSLNNIKELHKAGKATKNDYATALGKFQEYVNEVKSKQRDEAAACNADWNYY